jgi:hypothetical protein
MNGSRDRRLAKLEQHRRPAPRILHVWRDAPMESAKQAIARRFPKGVPAGARLVICSWQFDDKRILPARG